VKQLDYEYMVSLWILKDKQVYTGVDTSEERQNTFFELENSFLLYFDTETSFKIHVF
jgi:hypothetical protein